MFFSNIFYPHRIEGIRYLEDNKKQLDPPDASMEVLSNVGGASSNLGNLDEVNRNSGQQW